MQIIHHINSTFILFLLFLNCIIKYNILLGGNDMSDYIFCESKAYLRFLEEMKIRNFSENTHKSYCWIIQAFSRHVKIPLEQITREDLRQYILFLCDRKVSVNTMNLHAAALRFFGAFCLELGSRDSLIPPRKGEHKIIRVLSKEEVHKILQRTKNLRARAILTTIYAAGLRVSELIQLKIEDLDGQRMLIRIHQGKGKKDRIVPFPKELQTLLREYYREVRPKIWLFTNNSFKTNQIKTCTIRSIWKRAKLRAEITKVKGIHTLGLAHQLGQLCSLKA